MKIPYFKAIVFLLLFFVCIICFALTTTSKNDTQSLARDYAPVFHFDFDEKFFPCNYSKYYYDDNGQEITNSDHAIKKYLESSEKPVIYYSTQAQGSKTIIQYWLFYVYNDFINKHYGDAETITVIIDENSDKKVVVGSAHLGNTTKIAVANNQITQNKTDISNILVELGSHANCPDKDGDLSIGAQELDNWYNAYGIFGWDEIDKNGARLTVNNYELIPLSALEEELAGKEKMNNANNLGIEINLKGDIFGYNFDNTTYIPIGGNSVSLASIQQLKDNPGTVIPFSIGKDINNLSDLMIKNYSSQNPYRPDLANLDNNSTTTPQITQKELGTKIEDKKEIATSTPPVIPAITHVATSTPAIATSSTTVSDKEYQKLLEENKMLKQALLNNIGMQLNEIQKEVDALVLAQSKIKKQIKGASTTKAVILIDEFASGVENADQEYVVLSNPTNKNIDLSKDFDLYIVSGSKQTNKRITWKHSTIKANSKLILADASLDSKIKIDGYFSSGITQESQVEIKYNDASDLTSLSEPLKTGYCAKRNIDDFNISQDCIIKMPEKKNDSEPKTTSTKTTKTTKSSNQGSGGAPNPTAITENPIFYPVIINEVMYNPQGKEADREWIEIYNNSSSTVNLTNWKFFENDTNHGLYLEQGNINLEPFEYAVIVQDKTEFLKDYHDYSGTILRASFSLNDSEILSLKNNSLIIDTLDYSSNYGAQDNGYSLQLINGKWLESIPSPGLENILKYHPLITSFNFSPTNPTINQNVIFDASSSTPINEIINFAFNIASTTINSTSSIINYSFNATGTYEISLAVSNKYFATSTIATSSITVLENNISTTTPTSTQDLIIPEIIAKDSVIINEIMYDPNDDCGEWIEIYNNSTSSINNINFFEGTEKTPFKILSINAGEYFVIADEIKNGCFDSINNIATTSLTLNNLGEQLTLKDSQDNIINQVDYLSDWGGNKNNNSLQLIDSLWKEACPTPGKENQSNFCLSIPGTESDATADYINSVINGTPLPTSTDPIATSTEQTTTTTSPI
jgi:hypothetical protein